MAEVAYPKLAYTPVVAKRLGRNAESIEIACKYLARTGDSSLRAEIASLGLQSQSNLRAAYNLLDDTNEGKVVVQILRTEDSVGKAQRAKSGQTTTESAIQIEKLLRPGPEHATDSEVAIRNMIVARRAIFTRAPGRIVSAHTQSSCFPSKQWSHQRDLQAVERFGKGERSSLPHALLARRRSQVVH
jgi:hypothetical protein